MEKQVDIFLDYQEKYLQTQKCIIIGKNASMLKKIGMEARKELEETSGKKVYLDLQVKVVKDWRKKSKDMDKMY